MHHKATLIALILILLLCALIGFIVIRDVRQPRIVAAQEALHTLTRIGPNAARPLRPGEWGWLVGSPGIPDQVRACDGCTLKPLGCNAVCTYQVLARRLDWIATVDGAAARQGARFYFPAVGR